MSEESQLSYEDAAARVETIIRRLDSGEASLKETLELVKEGKMLIERCASELESVSGALETPWCSLSLWTSAGSSSAEISASAISDGSRSHRTGASASFATPTRRRRKLSSQQ